MMSKRRRTSSDIETDDSDDDSGQYPITPASIRKRKKLDPMEQCQSLYESIRNFKKEDGTQLCDIFIRAPKRRQEPNYYEIVTNPIDLLRVQQKLKTDSYEDIDDLTTDIELLVNNAKAFYKPDSNEYKDACTLWDVYNSNKAKLVESMSDETTPSAAVDPLKQPRRIGRPRKSTALDDDQTSENSSENNDFDPYEELFAAIMTATDPADDRSLHTMFQLLPSKKHYPDYYAVIDHPIDLKFIANKIQTNAYTSLNDMEKDVLQMVKNAQIFNEPGSQIYKDAKTLKRVFLQRKTEIEGGKYKRPPRGRGRQISYSAACAALKEELDSSEEEMDDLDDETQTGPCWALFDNLYNQSSSDGSLGGSPLGESLWKLPNKRFHPEYYNIIKKPLSMSMIQKKLKKNEYANVTELSTDLYLMIDNAKKANLPSSKIYKDAVKMQKILNQKLVDDGLDDDDTEDTEDSSQHNSVQGSVDKKKKGRPRIHPVSTSPAPIQTPPSTKYYKFPNNPVLKKKLMAIHKYMLDYTFDGRQPAEPFYEKPSKKLYPDYYTIIQHPIDMNTIQKNIENDRYGTVDDIVGDYRLMFNNCRKYNEENSMIYDDANMLERILNDKLKELSGIGDRKPKMMKLNNKKAQAILDAKLKKLYETIRDYKDPKTNRQVATIFMKLPSKMEYPDYYEIISKPIDLEKIGNKLKMSQYDTVDELSADLMLMFENACKYNEPDSQIYKDALMLQQVCIQTKQELRMEDENVPDVPQVVLDLLMQLFTSVYNYQDEEGRCYSDSMAELPEQDEIEGGLKQRAITLDLIKRRLDKGIYKRLDTFQEDMFACFERARRLSRTDSQVFEDSIEMQSFFIKKRDELCKNGEFLSSPALSYSAMHLSAGVEAIRQTKLLQEEEPEAESSTVDVVAPAQSESMSMDNGKIFTPGDFVYYSLTDDQTPGILYIERLYTDPNGEKLCHGNVYLRPYQTYHLTTRKFLEQEVFKSDQHQTIPLKELQQKCYVMSVKDYFKLKPEGFLDKDVYVCEFRYNSRARSFKKIKAWPFQTNNTKLMLREEPLEPKRVQSVFKDRPVDPLKLDIPIDEVDLALTEKEKPNVEVIVQGNDDALNTYYEQFNTVCSGVVKTGDYVYVATESGKQAIAQINSIWETKEGKSFFRGPWILTPTELPPSVLANHLQFRQEVFLSTVQETTPTIGIVGKCCVLETDEYTTRRPTEVPEADVYLCESIYDEFNKQIKKLQGSGHLKKFTHTQMVTPDEILFFRRPITIQRMLASELDSKAGLSDIEQLKMEANGGGNSCDFGMTEDSMDTDVGSDGFALNTSSPIPTTVLNTPAMSSKRPAAFTGGKSGKKVITGYILYSSEVRKAKVLENPECKFGDISRMIGDEWRSLGQHERRQWEDRASAINEQNASKYAEEMALNGGRETGKDSPNIGSSMSLTPNQLSMQHEFIQNQVFECCWDKCDFQFEDPGDALEHTITDSNGCVQRHFQQLAAQNEPMVYHCLWRNCIRARRNQPPLPNIQRLMKHVREVHVVKAPGKIVQPQDRGKNYVASTRKHLHQHNQPQQQVPVQTHQQIVYHPHQPVQTTPMATGSPQMAVISHHQPPVTQNIINYVSTPVEPLFVTVPPRPQRVLHSEAYIKYIEGLQTNNTYVGNWEKSVKATRETINHDVARLPAHWLGSRGREKPEEVIDALWKLRNFMWKDAFTLSKSGF